MAKAPPYVLTPEQAADYAAKLRVTEAALRAAGEDAQADTIAWVASNYEKADEDHT